MTDVAQEYGRRLKIRGYRPGHIPLRLVLEQVDEETLRKAAVERLTRQVVKEALSNEKLEPVAPVGVRNVAESPLTLELDVPLKPRVDLGDYRSLRVPGPEIEPVTDEDIDQVLNAWRKDMAYRAPAERPAAIGDTLTLSLKGHWGEEMVFEAEDLELTLTTDGATAAGLPAAIVDHLVGVAPGDAPSFQLRYPEFWSRTDLQGQEVSFEAQVVAVSTLVQPELDDDLAREVSGVGSLAELRERVRSQLAQRNELASRDRYLETVLDALVAQAKVEYPPELLDAEVAEIIADLQQRVERQGFTFERWLELSQKDEDALWDEIEPQARRRLERALVLSAFAAAEGIQVDEREVDEELKRIGELARDSGRRITLKRSERRDLAARMRTSRTFDRLLAIATGAIDEAGHPQQPEDVASEAGGEGPAATEAGEGQVGADTLAMAAAGDAGHDQAAAEAPTATASTDAGEGQAADV